MTLGLKRLNREAFFALSEDEQYSRLMFWLGASRRVSHSIEMSDEEKMAFKAKYGDDCFLVIGPFKICYLP